MLEVAHAGFIHQRLGCSRVMFLRRQFGVVGVHRTNVMVLCHDAASGIAKLEQHGIVDGHLDRLSQLVLAALGPWRWLRGAALEDVDYREGEAPRLTIRLANRFAYEWVSQRLNTAIQRIADAMLGWTAEIVYTAPEAEEAGRNVTEPTQKERVH